MSEPKSKGEGVGLPFEQPIHEIQERLRELEELSTSTHLDLSGEVEALRERLAQQIQQTYAQLTAWDRVRVARHPERPVTGDYAENMFDEFLELHGDKQFGDDRAILTGFAKLRGRRFLLVGHRKGKTTKQRLACNFGCAHPEGYRKALRKMKLAEKLGLPIVTFINTPGAYPGIGAEERGQAAAIAENILEMFDLRVPIVTLVIGEGGSGGALGIGVADKVLMMEFAYYSVISPEGCAAILWKDASRTPDAAAALRLTATDLSDLGVIDGVVPEPAGGAHRDPFSTYGMVADAIIEALDELSTIPRADLPALRREKYRRMAAVEDRFPIVAG